MKKVIIFFILLSVYAIAQPVQPVLSQAQKDSIIALTDLKYVDKASLPYINVKDFGAVGDGITDDILAIQSAVDSAIEIQGTVFFPPGDYRITNTIWIGKTGTFITMSMLGNQGFGNGYLVGTRIKADFGDRPAINIQGGRVINIEGLNISGRNTDKVYEALFNPVLLDRIPNDESAYIDTGLTYGRYNPYVGISVDGYSSPQPDSQYYTNHAYDGATSYNVTIKNCTVTGFVVGIGISLSANPTSGAMTTIETCQIEANTYAVVGGGTQNRGNNVTNCAVAGSYILFDNTGRFGSGNAPPFKIFGGDMGLCYKLFNLTLGSDVATITGLYTEAIKSIGTFGIAGAIDASAIITGSNFNFAGSTNYGIQSALAISSATTIEFNGCTFASSLGVLNSIGAKFNSCKFVSYGGANWNDVYYVGRTIYRQTEPILENSSVRTDYLGGNTFKPINYTQRAYSGILPSRIEFTPTSTFIQTADSLYMLYPGASDGMVTVSIDTTEWMNDSLHITAATAGEFAEGDIIYWYNKSVYIPMLKVSSVNLIDIVATKLFDSTNYDYTYDPDYIYIAQREWATNEILTGDIISGSDTIFNISDTTVIMVGDFIKGFGLPTITRVEYVGGDTVVISKNATATKNGISLYYGKIKNIRQGLSDLSGLENIVNEFTNYVPLDSTGLVSNQIYVEPNYGFLQYTLPVNIVTNSDMSNWTGTGRAADPNDWVVVGEDTTTNYFEQNPTGELHYVYADSAGETVGGVFISTPSISFRTPECIIGERYGYSFDVTQINGYFTIGVAGNAIETYNIPLEVGHYSGIVVASHPWAYSIYREQPGVYGDITLDNLKVWKMNGDIQAVNPIISVPDTAGVTDGYAVKYVGGNVIWSPDISTSGTGLFHPDGATIDTTAGGLARIKPSIKSRIDSVWTKQPLEPTLTDIADGTITENLVNTANPWDDNEVANNITVDDAGIASTIARDSEVSALLVAFPDTLAISWGMMDTVLTGDVSGWKAPNNITITEISSYTNSGTVTFNLEERGETTPNTAGTDVMTSDLVADTDQQETSTFSNSTLDRNDWLVMNVTSITGDPTIFSVSIRYVKTN